MEDFNEYASAVSEAFQSREIAQSLLDRLNAEGQAKVAPLETIGTIAGVKLAEMGIPKIAELGRSLGEQAVNKAKEFVSDKVSDISNEIKSTVQNQIERVKGVINDKVQNIRNQVQNLTDDNEPFSEGVEMQNFAEIPMSQEEALQQIATQARPDMSDVSLYPEGTGAPETGAEVSQAVENVSPSISESLTNISESIMPTISETLQPIVGEGLSSVASGIGGALEGVSAVSGAVSGAVEGATGAITGAVEGATEAIGATVGSAIGAGLSFLGPVGLIGGLLGGLIPSLVSDHEAPPPLNPSTQFL